MQPKNCAGSATATVVQSSTFSTVWNGGVRLQNKTRGSKYSQRVLALAIIGSPSHDKKQSIIIQRLYPQAKVVLHLVLLYCGLKELPCLGAWTVLRSGLATFLPSTRQYFFLVAQLLPGVKSVNHLGVQLALYQKRAALV